MRARRFQTLAAALLALIALGCPGDPGSGPAGPAARRDVLLITVDTLRYDAVSHGGGRAETPQIDRLAAAGWWATFAHAHSVVTLPSHASILTGRLPYQHGIRDNAGFVLAPGERTLAEALRERGYRTGAFVSAFTLDRRYGLDRGFETYDDRYDGYGERGFSPPERPGDETVARALEWWEAHRGEPRFLWVHTFTPHYPYDPGPPYDARHADAPYFGDVELADRELAPLLERVLDGPDGDTVVVLTSDHGEGLGDHGEATHGLFAYESTLHVPLVVYARGLVEPARIDAPLRHVDVLPTLLAWTGTPAWGGLAGAPIDPADPPPPFHYFEALSSNLNRGWAPLYGRLEGRTKAIDLPLPELYDLDEDPTERDNLAGRASDRMRRILGRIPEEARRRERNEPIDAEQAERLRSLGYVAGSAVERETYDASLDPKTLAPIDALLDRALARYQAGEIDGAIADLRALIRRQPSMALAYSHLSFFLADRGDVDAAVRLLQQAVERGIANESIRRKLALNLLRTGDAPGAARALEPHRNSVDPETQSALGRTAALAGDFAAAEAHFSRAVELDATYPAASMDLGLLRMMQGRFSDAEPLIERALAEDPFLAEAWNARGAIRARAGDADGAIEAWRKAVEIDPRLTDALFNLAIALAGRGERGEAERWMRRYAGLVRGEERDQAEAWLRRLGGAANR